ncbi:hypothetical protein HDU96_002010 [Phlyctochytrium bullatum]|nr:hypothetical protein HDU96_002010 [Phlyctochytrium bullatum]
MSIPASSADKGHGSSAKDGRARSPAEIRLRSLLRENATVVAATAASVSAVTAGYPFDLVKTRMQAFRYKSIDACVAEIYRAEGFFGFFTGLGPVVTTISIFRSITFTVYTDVRGRIGRSLDATPWIPSVFKTKRTGGTTPTSSTALAPSSADGYLRVAIMSLGAGTVSGSVVATLNAPLEFIKVQRQLDALIQKAALQQSPASPSPPPSSTSSTRAPPAGASNPSSSSFRPTSSFADVRLQAVEAPSNTPSGPAGGIGEGFADPHESQQQQQQQRSTSTSKSNTSSTTNAKHPSAKPMSSSSFGAATAAATPNGTSSHARFVSNAVGIHPSAAAATGAVVAPTPRPAMNLFQWMNHIVALKGVPGLFSGYQWHLARDGTGTALYFGIYEVTKKFLVSSLNEGLGVPVQFVHMASGGFAGTASWLVLFPIDMVKSVIQREALNPNPKYRRGVDFIRHRYAKSGIAGFYRGIAPQLIRSFPVHALNFLVYEQVVSWCRAL